MEIFHLLLRKIWIQTWFCNSQQYPCLFLSVFEYIPNMTSTVTLGSQPLRTLFSPSTRLSSCPWIAKLFNTVWGIIAETERVVEEGKAGSLTTKTAHEPSHTRMMNDCSKKHTRACWTVSSPWATQVKFLCVCQMRAVRCGVYNCSEASEQYTTTHHCTDLSARHKRSKHTCTRSSMKSLAENLSTELKERDGSTTVDGDENQASNNELHGSCWHASPAHESTQSWQQPKNRSHVSTQSSRKHQFWDSSLACNRRKLQLMHNKADLAERTAYRIQEEIVRTRASRNHVELVYVVPFRSGRVIFSKYEGPPARLKPDTIRNEAAGGRHGTKQFHLQWQTNMLHEKPIESVTHTDPERPTPRDPRYPDSNTVKGLRRNHISHPIGPSSWALCSTRLFLKLELWIIFFQRESNLRIQHLKKWEMDALQLSAMTSDRPLIQPSPLLWSNALLNKNILRFWSSCPNTGML